MQILVKFILLKQNGRCRRIDKLLSGVNADTLTMRNDIGLWTGSHVVGGTLIEGEGSALERYMPKLVIIESIIVTI